MSEYMINEMPGITCPKCEKEFAVDEVENDDTYWLSPCCWAEMGKINEYQYKKDIERQKIIEQALHCKFLRIKDN